MTSKDPWGLVVPFFVKFTTHGDGFAGGVGSPTWVGPAPLGLKASQSEGRFDAAGVVILFRIDAASVQTLNLHLAIGHSHACQVVGSLHQPFDVRAHAMNPDGTGLDRQQQGVLIIFAHDVRGQVCCSPLQHEIGVCCGVFCLQHIVGGLQRGLQCFQVGLGKHHHAFGFSRYGVPQPATVDFRHTQINVVQGLQQDSVHEFVRVGQAFVDVHTAVSPRASSQHDGQGCVAFFHCLLRGVGAARGQVHAAGTSDADFVVVFRVEVEQNVSAEEPTLQAQSTGHSGFLVDGEQGFQGRVLDVRTFQHRQNAGDTDAVVGAERCALSTHPIAVNHHADAFRHEVEFSGLVFLANHVHMALENDGFSALHSRS